MDSRKEHRKKVGGGKKRGRKGEKETGRKAENLRVHIHNLI